MFIVLAAVYFSTDVMVVYFLMLKQLREEACLGPWDMLLPLG